MAHPPEAWTVGFDQLEVAEGHFVVQSNRGVREVLWTTDVLMRKDADRGRDNCASQQPTSPLGRILLKGRGAQGL